MTGKAVDISSDGSYPGDDFQKALLATSDKTLYHTMGKSDPTRTILTEEEFCELLTKIRTALKKKQL